LTARQTASTIPPLTFENRERLIEVITCHLGLLFENVPPTYLLVMSLPWTPDLFSPLLSCVVAPVTMYCEP
jgi:hypothetical protein